MKKIAGATALVLATAAIASTASTRTNEAGAVLITSDASQDTPLTTAQTSSTSTKKAATQSTTLKLASLPPLDLSDMKLWNWDGKWHASEWDNAFSPIPWRYNHISQNKNAVTIFTLDRTGAPELQAQKGIPANLSGLWETDVTLPQLRDGVVVAPLWLYDTNSKDEIDFEFAGKKGLDVSLHTYVNGAHKSQTVRLFAGTDFSGRRMRFGIHVDQKLGTIEMLVDGVSVHRWERSKMPFFVSKPLKPWMEMWAASPSNASFVQWVGKWTGFGKGESMIMKVHGYDYKAI